jgi:elongation factor G
MRTFEPLISLEIEPKTPADQKSPAHGLQRLMAEDAMFRVQTDAQTGRATMAGTEAS